MNRSIQIVCVAAIVAALGMGTLSAEVDIYYDDGGSHTINDATHGSDYIHLDSHIANSPGTNLNLVAGGQVFRINARNYSTVNISGGYSEYLMPYDNSTVTMSGGESRFVQLDGYSSLIFSGGMIRNFVNAKGNSRVTISGRNAPIYDLYTRQNGTAIVNGGWWSGKFTTFTNGKIYLNGLEGTHFSVIAGGVTTVLSDGARLSDYGEFVENGDKDYLTGMIVGTLASGRGVHNYFTIWNSGYYGGTADIIIGSELASTSITAPLYGIVGPGGDGEVGGLSGIWLRGDGVGGDPNYRWSISGGPEGLPLTELMTLPDTNLDGGIDDYFLTFADLAAAGAMDRAAITPYTLRLEALDSSGVSIVGGDSEISLLIPEPATLSLLALGGLAVLRRRRNH